MALIAVLVMLPAVLLGCGEQTEQEEPKAEEETIKVGCVLSMSGALGAMGSKMTDAVKLAVEEINAEGGINGKQVKLFIEDDATDAAQCLNAVKKLNSVDGVQLMVAAMTSGAGEAVGPYLADNEVLVVSPGATSPMLIGKPWRDYFFRTAPNDVYQGRAMAEVTVKRGFKNVVIFVMDNPYGIGLGEAASEALTEKGTTVIDFVKYDPAKLDYLTELTHIKSLNPDVVIHVGYYDDGRIVYKQALDLGLDNMTWIGGGSVYGTGMFENGAAAEFMGKCVIGTRPTAPEGTEEYENFRKAFETQYNTEPEVLCDNAYDAMKMLALAVEKAGGTDPDVVRAALKEVGQNYNGASGEITFNEGNDRIGGLYEVWSVVTENGEKKFKGIDAVEIK